MRFRSRPPQAVDDADNLGFLRDRLKEIGDTRDEWAGIPMPLDGFRLVIEPRYPKAAELSAIGAPADDDHGDDGWSLVNSWYSRHHRCEIVIMRGPDGKVTWGRIPAFHHLKHDIMTLGASDAWGLEQEARAVELLRSMVTPRAFRQYTLTGMFLETSRRSGVTYLFRRLKPTVACTSDKSGKMRILAALCMHPIAYYAGSWAGAMCPTDDVIAHLALMRGDEHLFWRRSNQHAPYRPEAGL